MKNKIFTKLLSITLVCVMLVMSMGAYGVKKAYGSYKNMELYWMDEASSLDSLNLPQCVMRSTKTRYSFKDILMLEDDENPAFKKAKYSLSINNTITLDVEGKLQQFFIDEKPFLTGVLQGIEVINMKKYLVYVNIDKELNGSKTFTSVTLQPLMSNDPEKNIVFALGEPFVTYEMLDRFECQNISSSELIDTSTLLSSANQYDEPTEVLYEKVDSDDYSSNDSTLYMYNSERHNRIALAVHSKNDKITMKYKDIYPNSPALHARVSNLKFILSTVNNYDYGYIEGQITKNVYDTTSFGNYIGALANFISAIPGLNVGTVLALTALSAASSIPSHAGSGNAGSTSTEWIINMDYHSPLTMSKTLDLDDSPMLAEFILDAAQYGYHTEFKGQCNLTYKVWINNSNRPMWPIATYYTNTTITEADIKISKNL